MIYWFLTNVIALLAGCGLIWRAKVIDSYGLFVLGSLVVLIANFGFITHVVAHLVIA